MFASLLRLPASVSTRLNPVQSCLVLTRTLMKTHKGAAKRWRYVSKLGTFKRGKSGRQHGNVGWSRESLKHLSGRTNAHSTHVPRLKKLLPFY